MSDLHEMRESTEKFLKDGYGFCSTKNCLGFTNNRTGLCRSCRTNKCVIVGCNQSVVTIANKNNTYCSKHRGRVSGKKSDL